MTAERREVAGSARVPERIIFIVEKKKKHISSNGKHFRFLSLRRLPLCGRTTTLTAGIKKKKARNVGGIFLLFFFFRVRA